MRTQRVDIKTPDGICDAYVAWPGNGSFPAVILYPDVSGPRPSIYKMAEKLASHGYYVLLPNIFYRFKNAPLVNLKLPMKTDRAPDAVNSVLSRFRDFEPELAMKDAGYFLDFLKHQKNVRDGKIGVVGYSMGGALAIRMASRYPEQVAAAASFHAGNLASEAKDSPHLELNKIKADLYIAHADNDKSMPTSQIERLKETLEKAEISYTAELYVGALHGFAMEDLPAFSQMALDRHWQNLLDLLNRNLAFQQLNFH